MIKKTFFIIYALVLSACAFLEQKPKIIVETSPYSPYLINYSMVQTDSSFDLVYYETIGDMFVEKERHNIIPQKDSYFNIFDYEKGLTISVFSEVEDRIINIPYTVDEYQSGIKFNLIQDTELSKKETLIFLSCEKMDSIQSEVQEDWRHFRGKNGRAIVIELK